MGNFEITGLLDGRPKNIENLNEKKCYDILDNLDIEYQRVEYNFFPNDIDSLKLIDRVLEVEGIKNLIFRTKNKNQYYFIVIPRDKRFDEKAFREKYQLPKITMAKDDELEELLKTRSGSVSIMGLVNDEKKIIKLFIDKSIFDNDYFRFHPNDNKATLRIKMDDFKNKLIPFLKHDINLI